MCLSQQSPPVNGVGTYSVFERPPGFRRPRGLDDPWRGGKARSCSATLMMVNEEETIRYLAHLKHQYAIYHKAKFLSLVIVGAETAPTTGKPHIHLALYVGDACSGPRSSSWFQGIIHPFIMAHLNLHSQSPLAEFEYIHERLKNGTRLPAKSGLFDFGFVVCCIRCGKGRQTNRNAVLFR